MSLIPQVPWSEFKKLNARQLREIKSCEITSDGEYVGTFVSPQTDYIKVGVENLAQLGNAVGGKPFEEITGKEVVDASHQ